MSAFTEPTPSGRYRGVWRLGRGKKHSRTFDFEYQAQQWAEDQEAAAIAAASDAAAVARAAQIDVTGVDPADAPRKRGRPRATPISSARTEPSAPTTPTLAEYAEEWLNRQDHLKRKGHTGYRTDLNFIRDWHSDTPDARLPKPLGEYHLEELTPDIVRDWRADQTSTLNAAGETKWSNNTINSRFSRVRQICKAAALSGKCPGDPTAGIQKLPPKPKNPHRALTDAEQTKLINAADPTERIHLLLGLRVGLRWEEVCGLPVSAITRNQDGLTLIEVRQVNEGDGVIRHESTKTGDDPGIDFRTVPVPPGFADELWDHATDVRAERGPDALLLTAKYGSAWWYRNWLRDVWVPLRARAGLHRQTRPKPPKFHDLRHTWATKLGTGGESGVPVALRDIMALGGWRKIETVQKYQHSSSVAEHAAVMARVFEGPQPLAAVPEKQATG